MTLEPLRAELMAVTMTTDRFRKIMALVMNLEAAAYARGARDAMVPMEEKIHEARVDTILALSEWQRNTRPQAEAPADGRSQETGGYAVGINTGGEQ